MDCLSSQLICLQQCNISIAVTLLMTQTHSWQTDLMLTLSYGVEGRFQWKICKKNLQHWKNTPKNALSHGAERGTLTRLGSILNFDLKTCLPESMVAVTKLRSIEPRHQDCPTLFIVGARYQKGRHNISLQLHFTPSTIQRNFTEQKDLALVKNFTCFRQVYIYTWTMVLGVTMFDFFHLGKL